MKSRPKSGATRTSPPSTPLCVGWIASAPEREAALVAEVRRLRETVALGNGDLWEALGRTEDDRDAAIARAEKAEADNAALKEALTAVSAAETHHRPGGIVVRDAGAVIADAALAAYKVAIGEMM